MPFGAAMGLLVTAKIPFGPCTYLVYIFRGGLVISQYSPACSNRGAAYYGNCN